MALINATGGVLWLKVNLNKDIQLVLRKWPRKKPQKKKE
ncbi:MAG: hypothetical protein ACJAZT_000144 [Gammaproteobacteria bacterium]|jgi:hypothetical protein